MLGFFASMGIPGFSGFIGEILVVLGAFKSAGFNQYIPRWVALLSTLGMLLSAGYYLYTARKMLLGPFWVRDPAWQVELKDITLREYFMLIPLFILILALGLFPQALMEYLDPSVSQMVLWVQGK
jgi:NADH-quinone oxidoreductase subunit M